MTLSLLFQRGPIVVQTRLLSEGVYSTEITIRGDLIKKQLYDGEQSAIGGHAHYVQAINGFLDGT